VAEFLNTQFINLNSRFSFVLIPRRRGQRTMANGDRLSVSREYTTATSKPAFIAGVTNRRVGVTAAIGLTVPYYSTTIPQFNANHNRKS